MDLQSRTFSEGEMIPERCAYGRLGEGGKTVANESASRLVGRSGRHKVLPGRVP